MLATSLQKAQPPAISGPNQLVIRFPSVYNRDYASCLERSSRVEDSLARLTGEKSLVRFELIQSTADDIETTQNPASLPAEDRSFEPLFDEIVKSLDAKLLRVDDDFGRVIKSTEESTDWNEPEEE